MTRRILISVLLLVLLGSNGVDSGDIIPDTGNLTTTGKPIDNSTITGPAESVPGVGNTTQPSTGESSTQDGSAPEATNVTTTSEEVSEPAATVPPAARNGSDPVGGSSLVTESTIVQSSTVNTVAVTETVQSSSEVPVTSAGVSAETAASAVTATAAPEDSSQTSTDEDSQETGVSDTTVVPPAPDTTSRSEETSVNQGTTAATAAQSTAAAVIPVTITAADKANTAASTQPVVTTVSQVTEEEPSTSEQPKVADTEPATTKQATEPTKEPTTVAQTESTIQGTATPTDPCSEGGHIKIPREKERYYKNTDVSGPHDGNLEEDWYKFTIDDEVAEIPRVCIKPGYCGADMPYTMDPNFQPPQKGQNATTELQGSYVQHGRTKCSADQRSVVVLNCGDFYVYKWIAVVGISNICLKKKNDKVEYKYLGNPPPTDAPTTETPLDLPSKEAPSQYTVTIVTSNKNGKLTNSYLKGMDNQLRKEVAAELNKKRQTPVVDTEKQTTTAAPTVAEVKTTEAASAATAAATAAAETPAAAPTTSAPTAAETTVTVEPDTTAAPAPTVTSGAAGPAGPAAVRRESQRVAPPVDGDVDGGPAPPKRFRRNSDTVYTKDHVFYVSPTPRVKDNQMEITIFVEHDKDGYVDGDTLLAALRKLNETGALENMTGETVIDIYKGSPEDIAVAKPAKSIWQTHMGLFITVIILAVICIILLIIGLICLRCERTGRYSTNNPEKTAITLEEGRNGHGSVESPLSDEEIIRGEASTLQAATPSYTANGRGQHISKEEDNGWVVPINELSDQERSLVDTEDTKL